MSAKKDKDTIKREVLEKMRNNGAMNHLQSSYISKIASIIKNIEGFDFLKPYKTIRTEKPFVIASQLVIQYFQKKSLEYSLSTITDESDGAIDFSNSNLVADEFNINSDGVWLDELLADWNSVKSTVVSKNKSEFLQKIQERLDEVLPENEKYIPNGEIRSVEEEDSKQTSKPAKTPTVQPAKPKQEEPAQTKTAKPSQSSDDVFSKSDEDIEDIQINDEDTDNEMNDHTSTTNQNKIEQAPKPAKPSPTQSPKNQKEELTQSQKSKSSHSSVDIFSKSDEDIEDIQISNGESDIEANVPTDTKNTSNIDVKNESNSQFDDFEIDEDNDFDEPTKEDKSNNSKPATNTNKANSPATDTNKINSPAKSSKFSDSFDEMIEIDGSDNSFDSPDKEVANSSRPQTQPNPTTAATTSTPAKENTANLVTQVDEFDDFDDDDDIEVIGVDNPTNKPESPSPKQQKAPQKQETKPETPKKADDSIDIELDNNDSLFSDNDIDFDDD